MRLPVRQTLALPSIPSEHVVTSHAPYGAATAPAAQVAAMVVAAAQAAEANAAAVEYGKTGGCPRGSTDVVDVEGRRRGR